MDGLSVLPAQNAVISHLEEALEQAKAGQVHGVLMILQIGDTPRDPVFRYEAAGTLHTYAAVGALEYVKSTMLQQVSEKTNIDGR